MKKHCQPPSFYNIPLLKRMIVRTETLECSFVKFLLMVRVSDADEKF